jgi:outer membrane protein assembly factor BamB
LLRTILVAGGLVWLAIWSSGRASRPPAAIPVSKTVAAVISEPDSADGIKIGTFLGGPERRFYGKGPVPEKLDLIWKARLGSGWTNRKEDGKDVVWSGTGWTGQPSLVRDGGKLSLVINAYDHKLHRIDAADGHSIWEYAFDDVIKSSVTIFRNPSPKGREGAILVTAGSRRGLDMRLGNPLVAPYRAVSFRTGKEMWRLPVPRTANYSRDVDASGLFFGGALYEAVEPGYVYKLDPFTTTAWSGKQTPAVLARSRELWDPADVKAHSGEPGGSNLCIEASPAILGDRLYMSAGSGHVYGLSLKDLSVQWDFRTGSDLDGSTVVTADKKLLVPVERQYVKHGGVYLLDPSKPPKESVVWWFPTQDRGISEWAGGVIGSVAVNDSYDAEGTRPSLAAFTSVDGFLYVVSRDELSDKVGYGPHGEKLPRPKQVFKGDIGAGISTPAMVDDYIVATGYDKKVHLYRVDFAGTAKPGAEGVWLKARNGTRWFTSVHEVDAFEAGAPFEATPIVWKGRIYVGCRDGYLYCLGDKRQTTVEADGSATGD